MKFSPTLRQYTTIFSFIFIAALTSCAQIKEYHVNTAGADVSGMSDTMFISAMKIPRNQHKERLNAFLQFLDKYPNNSFAILQTYSECNQLATSEWKNIIDHKSNDATILQYYASCGVKYAEFGFRRGDFTDIAAATLATLYMYIEDYKSSNEWLKILYSMPIQPDNEIAILRNSSIKNAILYDIAKNYGFMEEYDMSLFYFDKFLECDCITPDKRKFLTEERAHIKQLIEKLHVISQQKEKALEKQKEMETRLINIRRQRSQNDQPHLRSEESKITSVLKASKDETSSLNQQHVQYKSEFKELFADAEKYTRNQF